jgi:hypothetical protein
MPTSPDLTTAVWRIADVEESGTFLPALWRLLRAHGADSLHVWVIWSIDSLSFDQIVLEQLLSFVTVPRCGETFSEEDASFDRQRVVGAQETFASVVGLVRSRIRSGSCSHDSVMC